MQVCPLKEFWTDDGRCRGLVCHCQASWSDNRRDRSDPGFMRAMNNSTVPSYEAYTQARGPWQYSHECQQRCLQRQGRLARLEGTLGTTFCMLGPLTSLLWFLYPRTSSRIHQTPTPYEHPQCLCKAARNAHKSSSSPPGHAARQIHSCYRYRYATHHPNFIAKSTPCVPVLGAKLPSIRRLPSFISSCVGLSFFESEVYCGVSGEWPMDMPTRTYIAR